MLATAYCAARHAGRSVVFQMLTRMHAWRARRQSAPLYGATAFGVAAVPCLRILCTPSPRLTATLVACAQRPHTAPSPIANTMLPSTGTDAVASCSSTINAGDLVIVYENNVNMKAVYVDPKARFECRFGSFVQKVSGPYICPPCLRLIHIMHGIKSSVICFLSKCECQLVKV
jgi:hypothetical protein